MLFGLTFSNAAKANTQTTSEGINACEALVTVAMAYPGLYATQAAQYAWSAMVGAAAVMQVPEKVCDSLDAALETNREYYEDFDTQEFLDENCGGEVGNCDDPLLSVQGECGIFESCPIDPFYCETYVLNCINAMIDFSDGFTTVEFINASTYLHSSFAQGYWHHESQFSNDDYVTDLQKIITRT